MGWPEFLVHLKESLVFELPLRVGKNAQFEAQTHFFLYISLSRLSGNAFVIERAMVRPLAGSGGDA